MTIDKRAEIERGCSNLAALGPARCEPGEREAMERLMLDADREAKEALQQAGARDERTRLRSVRDLVCSEQ